MSQRDEIKSLYHTYLLHEFMAGISVVKLNISHPLNIFKHDLSWLAAFLTTIMSKLILT